MSVVISAINHLSGDIDIAPEFARELRRADDFIRLAVMSVHDSLIENFPLEEQESNNWGLVVGSSFGPMETNFVVLDQIVKDEQTSPTYFSHSVFNGAAGYLTRIFNIRGYTATLTDFFYPFFQALTTGYDAVQSGLVKQCVVLQVESFSGVLQDARLSENPAAAKWPIGAVAWLLEQSKNEDHPLILNPIQTELTPSWQPGYLDPTDSLVHDGKTSSITHPLHAPFMVSDILNSFDSKDHFFEITSPNGTIKLRTGQTQ